MSEGRRRNELVVIWVQFVAGTLVWLLMSLVHFKDPLGLVLGITFALVNTLAAVLRAMRRTPKNG
jgi:hypothetical protein